MLFTTVPRARAVAPRQQSFLLRLQPPVLGAPRPARRLASWSYKPQNQSNPGKKLRCGPQSPPTPSAAMWRIVRNHAKSAAILPGERGFPHKGVQCGGLSAGLPAPRSPTPVLGTPPSRGQHLWLYRPLEVPRPLEAPSLS